MGSTPLYGTPTPRIPPSLLSECQFWGDIVALKGRCFQATINGMRLIVDTDEPEITWKGKRLKLNDLQDESYALFNALVPYYIDRHRR
jgi:hypothetical protein